jgi:hypothetical protein
VAPTNSYDIYPSTKVYQVYNAAIGKVDGTLWTEPATGTFTAGDLVEQPHYFRQHTNGTSNVVGSYIPSLSGNSRAALQYDLDGVWQGNDLASMLRNNSDPTLYQSYPLGTPWTIGRGQLWAPYGYTLQGPFGAGLYMNTPPLGLSNGTGAAVVVGCGSIGCANWRLTYNMLQAQGYNGSTTVNDALSYNPSVRAWILSGSSFILNTSGGGNVPVVFGAPTTGHLVAWGGGAPESLVDGGALAGSGAAITTGPISTIKNDAACFADTAGTLMDCGQAPAAGTVSSFAAPSESWPSWMVPSVANATIAPSLSVSISSIPNSALANAAMTVNGQSCFLGGSCTVPASSSTLTGTSLPVTVTGSSLTGVGTITSGTWQGTAISPSYISTGSSGTSIPLLNGSNTWSANTTTFANSSANSDYLVIRPGSSADQIGALEFANYSGASQWEIRKDASNTFRIRDTANSFDRFVQYAGGQTVINSGGSSSVAINNTSSAGTGGFTVYEGGANYNTLAFSVTGSGNASLLGAFTASSLIDTGVTSAALLGTNSTGSIVAETMWGDATLASGGALTLSTVNSTPGSFGSSTAIPAVTVNAKGLVSAITTNAVVAPAGTLSGTSLASNVVSSSLSSVGTITSGTWQGTPVANSYMANSSTVVNGQTCALGGSCTVTTAPTTPAFTTLTDGSTVTLATSGNAVTNAILTLNHATSTRALNATGLVSGSGFTAVLKQDSTGGAALTFGSGCIWYLGTNSGFAASTTPSLTSAANGINILSVLYDGTNCYANMR